MTEIAIIVGSTRPGRRSRAVAEWVAAQAARRHPQAGYSKEHTTRWAETIARYDRFVFVTPEYNHSIPGALKNALDFAYAEWNDKAAGFVSYGLHGAAAAALGARVTG